MLTVDGYINIFEFWLQCKRLIHSEFVCWEENVEKNGASSQLEEQYLQENRNDTRVLKEIHNINGAAQWLVFSIIWVKYRELRLLTARGDLLTVHPSIAWPDYKFVYEGEEFPQFEKEIGGMVHPSFFKTSEWQAIFATQDVFKSGGPYNRRCVVDWSFGCLDLTQLEREHRAARAKKIASHLSHIGSTDVNLDLDGLPQGKLAVLRPYHGCPVLVLKEAVNVLQEEASSRSVGDMALEGLAPYQKILRYLEENPYTIKAEIKAALFSDMADRQFSRHWGLAAAANPSISRPGRRKQEAEIPARIETDF
jgi:hypothetical protein